MSRTNIPIFKAVAAMTFGEFTAFAESLREEIAGIVDRYAGSVEVEYKPDDSPVTLADREIESYISSRIKAAFPTHAILGEECGAYIPENADSPDYEWVLDPIDGTKSFIHGVPLFTTLIGVMQEDRALYGAIYNPVLDQMLTGDGDGAYMEGRKVSMRRCDRLEDATLLITDVMATAKYRNQERFMSLASRCRMMRTWGDAYGYVMLATGRGDIMIDAKMSRWDIVALTPIIRGAGGVITGYGGEAPETADSIVAANPRLHTEVIRILNCR